MKFIHVTDPHLVAPGDTLHGLNPLERFEACIDSINADQSDAALCVITGDLADRGEIAAYRALKKSLGRLSIPYCLLLGNHDHRDHYLQVFPEAERDDHGFVQFGRTVAAGEFLFMDTLDQGEAAGLYCERRALWLRERLTALRHRPVYLFMHHPPFEIGIPSLDRISLKAPERFAEVVAGRDNIRHLFLGHVHRPVTGSWNGIPFSTQRGTNHQVALDFHTTTPIPYCDEPPAYAVVLLDEGLSVVHFHDYLHPARGLGQGHF